MYNLIFVCLFSIIKMILIKMKIKAIYIGILALGMTCGLQAQEDEKTEEPTRKVGDYIVKVNPFSTVINVLDLSFERKTLKHQSFQVNTLFIFGENLTKELGINQDEISDGYKFSGFAIAPEYRIYLGRSEELKGVYISPFYRLLFYKVSDESDEYSIPEITLTAHGIGLLAGYQAIIKKRFVIDLHAGMGWDSETIDYRNWLEESRSTFLRLGFNLGYTF